VTSETKVIITAETAQAAAAFRSLGSSVDGISRKIFDLQGLAGRLGAALTVTAFAGMLKSAVDLQDQLSKLSQKTGTSVEALAGLKFAADQNGTSLESVANAAKKLSTNLAENPDLFKKFGITAKDSTGALVQLADIFQAMPDGVDKVALAVKLLGKSGEEMIPFLNQGGAALREMVEQGQKLYPISTENAKAAAAFKDQLSLLKAQASTVGISIANDLLPPLNKLATEFLAARKAGLSFTESIRELGLRLPSNSIRQNIKNIDNEIAALEKWIATNNRATESMVAFQNEEIARKKKAREYFLDLERENALAGAAGSLGYRIEGRSVPTAPLGKGEDLLKKLLPKAKEKKEDTGAQVLIGLEKDYQNELNKRRDALGADLLSASERKLADDMRNVSKRAQDSRIDLEKLHISGTLSLENYKLQIAAVTEEEEKQRQAIADLSAEQNKLNSSFQYGARVALRDYMDEVENMAKQSQALFTTAFKGMEDALVQFVRTGKLDFSSLADSIISDLLRISLRQQLLGPLANLLGLGLAGGAGSTGAGGFSVGPGQTYTALGAAFTGSERFASGGIFDRPTAFKYANGGTFNLGIMGEAGPEAVMPLKRDAAGRLGVQSSGGGSINYSPVINIDSRTDQSEVARLVGTALKNSNEQLLEKLRRQGQIV